MTQLAFKSAVDLAKAIASGETSSLDLLNLYLARVEQHNPALNAVVALRSEEARREAGDADAALRKGERRGPLHGVPMTVKESFDVAGLPTTWGVKKLKDNIAAEDALAVRRLRKAGAIVFGKTNVPYLLSDWQSYNPIYGTTNNPWDVTRSPGGSSGGSAAALAGGLTGLDLGSDIGSSIRNPAHYCGVYGHKPTYGIASPRGQAPPGIVSVPDLSVIGPLARSAADLEVGLGIIAGPDEIDASGWQLTLPPPRLLKLRGLRIAVLRNSTIAPVDSEVGAVFDSLVDYLGEEGALIIEELPFDFAELHRLYILMLRAATSRNQTGAETKQYRAEVEEISDAQDDYWTLCRRGIAMGHRDWLLHNEQRHRIRYAWHEFFKSVDVLICPIASTAAVSHDHSEPRHERFIEVDGQRLRAVDQLFWAGLATLSYLPATSIPIGLTRSGLPAGAQIIGPQYSDLSTIAVAGLLERGFQGFIAPPAFAG